MLKLFRPSLSTHLRMVYGSKELRQHHQKPPPPREERLREGSGQIGDFPGNGWGYGLAYANNKDGKA
jgi:hypothetical protein